MLRVECVGRKGGHMGGGGSTRQSGKLQSPIGNFFGVDP